MDSTIISESSRSSNETAPSADEQKVISRKEANNYQVELDSGVFQKGGGTLTLDDKKRRIKALKQYSGTLIIPYRRHALDKKITEFEEHLTAEANRIIENNDKKPFWGKKY